MGMLARHKYLLLLIVVAAMLIWSSFAHRLLIRPIVTEALMTAVLIAVFLVVFTNRRERAVAFAIVAMAVAVKWSRYVYLPPEGSIVQPAAFHVLAAMFLTFAVYVILRNILAEKSVSRDDVFSFVAPIRAWQ